MVRIGLLATGGTIASRAAKDGRRPGARADDLLASIGATPAGLDVVPLDVVTRPSFSFGTADFLHLAREVRSALSDGLGGLVLTHGTDTMEETAFLLDLVHADPRPVVLTGAQRPFDDPAPDGPANLTDALRVAGAPVARNSGVLLAFDGSVFAARGVRKSDTLAAHAFSAPGRGPLFRVADRRVLPLARPLRPAPLPLDLTLTELPRVDVIAAYPGADGLHVRASRDAGAAGLVIAAMGVGNVGPALVESVAETVAAGVPVLITSRVPAGPVAPLYAGGGVDLHRAGAVFAGDLSPWQARILLAVACALAGQDPADVAGRWLDH